MNASEIRRTPIHEHVRLAQVAAVVGEALCDVVRETEILPSGARRIHSDRYFIEIDADAFATLMQLSRLPRPEAAAPASVAVGLAELRQEWEETLAVYHRTIQLLERLGHDASAVRHERTLVERILQDLAGMEDALAEAA